MTTNSPPLDNHQTSKDTALALQTLLDTFGGTDGGVSYVKFKTYVEHISENPDPYVMPLLTALHTTGAFIRAVAREPGHRRYERSDQ